MSGAARLVLAAAALLALSGCSAPSWMPLVGKAKAPEPPAPPPPPHEVRAPILSRPTPPKDDESVVDRVICVVNSDAVTLYELEEAEAYSVYETKQAPSTPEERAALREKTLAGIIEKRLQLQQAEREKIVVDDAEMKEQLDEIQKRLGAKNEVEFEQMVKAQGLSLDGVKKRLREQLLVERIKRRKVNLRISVTEEDIDQYLNANREKLETGLSFEARHILFVPTAGAGEDGWQAARRRGEDVYSRVMGGEEFGELAPDIEKAILRLSPGEHSSPFRSEVGYHLFELESKETLAGEQLTQARNQIRDILYKQKYEVRLNEWLVEIRGKAIIEMRL